MVDEWAVGEDTAPVEDGIYVATCVRVEDDHSELYNKDQLRIVFRIDSDGESRGQELARWVTKPDGAVRPKMKLYGIAEALLGVDLKEHGHLKRDDLIGKQAQILVKVVKKEDGTANSVIDSVVRYKNGAKPAFEDEDVKALNDLISARGLDPVYEAFQAALLDSYVTLDEDGERYTLNKAGMKLPELAKIKRLLTTLKGEVPPQA